MKLRVMLELEALLSVQDFMYLIVLDNIEPQVESLRQRGMLISPVLVELFRGDACLAVVEQLDMPELLGAHSAGGAVAV